MKDEHTEQVAVFNWATINSRKHPGLALMFAIPNGGHRHKAVAAKLKAEGVKSGVPDIFLPIPNPTSNGLFIEMKRQKGGTVSKGQEEWLKKLEKQGYKAVVCKGAAEAISVIEEYLSI